MCVIKRKTCVRHRSVNTPKENPHNSDVCAPIMYEPKSTTWASVIVNELFSFQLMAGSPMLDWFVLIAYQDFDSSLSSAFKALVSEPFIFFSSRLPAVTATSIAAYLSWVLFQAGLYILVPGRLHHAPRTPGGRRLVYKLNGFSAWILTVVLAAFASFAGLVDPALIAKHWTTAVATAALYSCALIGVFYVKARVAADDAGDTLLTGKLYCSLSPALASIRSSHCCFYDLTFTKVTFGMTSSTEESSIREPGECSTGSTSTPAGRAES